MTIPSAVLSYPTRDDWVPVSANRADTHCLPIHKYCFYSRQYPELLDIIQTLQGIHASTSFGWTPLIIASGVGSVPVVKYLLSQGADPNASTQAGVTALYMAAQNGHTRVTKQLLAYHANPNQLSFIRVSPLATAARRGFLGVVTELLRHGANPNVPGDGHGYPALHRALKMRHFTIANLLLDHGAVIHPTIENDPSLMEVYYQLRSNTPDLVPVYRDREASDESTPLLDDSVEESPQPSLFMSLFR